MTKPDPFRGPGYGWPTMNVDDSEATPAERALSALRIGAILAVAVTIALIYASARGGLRGSRNVASLIVIGAFTLPSLMAYLFAWRDRSRRRTPDPARNGEPPSRP